MSPSLSAQLTELFDLENQDLEAEREEIVRNLPQTD